MADLSTLQQKVNALKAKVEQSSISPLLLGLILDDFITHISDAISKAGSAFKAVTGLTDNIGNGGGIAPLDDTGKVPKSNLPQQLLYSDDPELASKLPQDMLPPAVTPDEMNNMGGGILAKYAGTHSRYRIVRADNGKIIGALDIFYDTTTQALTQVVTTHYDLEKGPDFTVGSPFTVGTFYRSRPLSSISGLTANESGWTDWKRMNVSPDTFGAELQKPDNAVKAYLPLFEAAIAPCGDTLWPEANFDRRELPARTSGYYPEVNAAAPFYVCGWWLNLNQVLAMITDRYTPFLGGVRSGAEVNIPLRTKTSDSYLKIDYACVNDSVMRVLVLGAMGWAGSYEFRSAYRAFHGNQLRAVIGEIDLRNITTPSQIANMFSNSSQLWQFHLANIPDAIETLDLSSVSDNCIENFTYADGASGTSSSLKYLLQNFQRDITRTKQLTVVVSPAVFAVVGEPGDMFWSHPRITWATV